MKPIYARKVIDEKGNEIIELDLNKAWPARESYKNPMNILSKMPDKISKRPSKEFITIMN